MNRTDLTNNWGAVILYHCGLQGSNRYKQDLSDVCEFSYDIDGYTYITNWYLSSPYTEPSLSTLLSYDLTTCNTYYENYYVLPDSIKANQPLINLTSTQISNIVMTSLNDGQLIFNTTTKRAMFYDHANSSFKTIAGA